MTKTVLKMLVPAALLSLSFVYATASYAEQQPGQPAAPGAQAAEETPKFDPNADWPCVQRRVENLTVSQIWDGPSIEGKKGWSKDKALSSVLTILASRRVPEADAEAALKKYADSVPEAERDEKLTLLFAGLFDKMNMERRSVISGIEKYQRAQKERAAELERQSTRIATLQDEAPAKQDAAKELDDANEKYAWAQRIFNERQQSLPLACELPQLIEERLFAMTRAIRALMKT